MLCWDKLKSPEFRIQRNKVANRIYSNNNCSDIFDVAEAMAMG